MPEDSGQELLKIWEGVRSELRDSVPASAFESWLEPLQAVGIQGTRLYIDGPDRVRDWFERRYVSLAVDALRKRVPAITEIVFSEPGQELERAARLERARRASSAISTSIAS